MTFKEWMLKVDEIIGDKVGLDSMSLPDAPYRDWYDDEMTPEDAVDNLADYLEDEFGDLVEVLR